MPGTVSLGPLAFATDRLLALGAVIAFILLLGLIGRRSGEPVTRATWIAILAGLVVGRLAFIMLHWRAYAGDWPPMLSFRQGGFDAQAGAFAAGASLLLTMKSRRSGVLGFAAVLFCFVSFTLGAMLLRPPARPMPAVAALRSLSGDAVPLDHFRGRPLVVNLWATWCPPCRRELPMLAQVAATSDIPVLLVDQAETPEQVRAFLAREAIPAHHVLVDRRGEVARAVNTSLFPTTLFLNAKGEIVATHYGEISRAALFDQMERLGGADHPAM